MLNERQQGRLTMLAWACDPFDTLEDPAPTPGSPWWPAGGMAVQISEYLPDGAYLVGGDGTPGSFGSVCMMNSETLSLIMSAVYRKDIVRRDLQRILATQLHDVLEWLGEAS